jgi:hypothetical protein
MYEMLTLQPPFTAATEVELIFAVRDAVKRDAIQIVRDIPVELNQILNKLMSRPRSQRYQTGEELADELRLFLEGYRPGYKRSHFGRFMRKLFEQDIERELRLLEEYVLDDGADPEEVGENLIAEALGKNALYTNFTAASQAQGTRVGSRSSKKIKKPDLHAEQTRIFDTSGSKLHAAETRIFDTNSLKRSRGFDEQTTGQRERHKISHSAKTPLTPIDPGPPTPRTPRTGRTPVTPRTGPTPILRGEIETSGELPRLETRIKEPPPTGKKFHDAKTQIIQRPLGERKRRDTTPAPPPQMPRLPKKPEADYDEDEETMLPLSDDDLLDP